ncbi:CBS domain-containing protein [Pedobacter sp. MR2016-19]|uniref:CBS domain-containing protein n=1 Tax=Pedobacter sp. MR2016-19 TaxID=2780089 RepID=UPI001875B77F|nr:CBS domain-containing protein [Pedobacter sp. MR2016-19]MBE5320943.1 CBS domain-containing protein [Pedobacter sp. MR2016-19]
MPTSEFIELVKKIKKEGKGIKMSKRDLIWCFDSYEKRTSGNVWRINEYLKSEKMIIVPSFQGGWIDEEIELKEKDKAKIKNAKSDCEEHTTEFDPISRLSILEAASKIPVSISRDADLEKAYHLLWTNDFSQIPVMNNDRDILGVIGWKSIAKGLIAKKKSNCVKDFMNDDFKILSSETPLFDAIREVIKSGVIFVQDKERKIRGPITPFDLNEEFIEQIEPYILLEQIENFLRLILHNKIVLEDIIKLLFKDDTERKIESISDMNFGEYLVVIRNVEMWEALALPFVRADFINELDIIRKIRNGVMHFHPDKISNYELITLRKMSNFLMDYNKNC